MSKTAATSHEDRKCHECRNFHSRGCGTQGRCSHWTSQTGRSGIVVTTHREWKACNGFDEKNGPDNPYPSRIEFDDSPEWEAPAAASQIDAMTDDEYYGDRGDGTSPALDDYFAGIDVPRDARDLGGDEREFERGPREVEVTGRDGTVYHTDHLKTIFDAVCNLDDWKGPIAAVIPPRAYAVVDTAVEFYTATRIRVTGGSEPITGRILIEADGYHAGPAGDH